MGQRSVPDFAEYSPRSFLYGNIPRDELAVRLKSVCTFFRSGNVIFIDGFEDGLSPYYRYSGEPNGLVSLKTDLSFMGANCCSMVSPDADNDKNELGKFIQSPYISKMGFEIAISVLNPAPDICIQMMYSNGMHSYMAFLSIDINNAVLSLVNSNGEYVIISDEIFFLMYKNYFQHVKLIVDLINLKYDKFYIGEDAYDLSTYSFMPYGEEMGKYIQFEVLNGLSLAGGRIAYIDNFIITINEL